MRKPGTPVRTPSQIKKVRDAIVAYITEHPKQNVKEIAKGMNTTTDDLRRDIERLIELRVIQYDANKRYTLTVSDCLLADMLIPRPPDKDTLPTRKIMLTDLPAQRVDPKRTTLSIGSSMGIDYVKYGGPT